MICRNCGTENRSGSKYCIHCGAELYGGDAAFAVSDRGRKVGIGRAGRPKKPARAAILVLLVLLLVLGTGGLLTAYWIVANTSGEDTTGFSMAGSNGESPEYDTGDAGEGGRVMVAYDPKDPDTGKNEELLAACTADYEVTDEELNTCFAVMDDLAEFLKTIPEASDVPEEAVPDDPDEWVVSEMTPGERIRNVQAYLEASPDVSMVWMENDQTLQFVTKDGLSCAYTQREIFDEEGQNLCGSGTGETEESAELLKRFEYDEEFRMAPTDPDVMVLLPISNSYSDRKGKNTRSAGEKLARFIEGSCTVFDDSGDLDSALNAMVNGSMADYGTVMLCTHGDPYARGDGTNYVIFSMFSDSSKNGVRAEAAWDRFTSTLTDPNDAQNCLKTMNDTEFDRELKSHPQTLIGFHIQETFKTSPFTGLIHYDKHKRYNICVTTNYLMRCYADTWFPNTIFYLGACGSFRDSVFNDFLLDHGAACVIGYSGSVYIDAEQAICKEFFNQMTKIDSEAKKAGDDHSKTIADAYDKGYGMVMEDLAGLSTGLGYTEVMWASLRGVSDFVYQGTGHVQGKVQSEEGEPIADVKVTCWRYWNSSLVEQDSTTSGSDGSYRLPDAPYGMYLITAEKDGETVYESVSFNETTFEHDIVMEVGSPLQVLVWAEEEDMSQTLNDGTVYFRGGCWPIQVFIPEFGEAERIIQKEIKATTDSFREDANRVKEDTSAHFDSDYGPSVYEAPLDDAFVSGQALSFSWLPLSYHSGSAHGAYGSIQKNYDAVTGSQLSLRDLLKEGADFSMLRDLWRSRLGDLDSLFYGPDECLSMIELSETMKSGWYFSKDGLTLVFPQGMISSYGALTIKVPIPYSDLKEIIKEEYLPADDSTAAGDVSIIGRENRPQSGIHRQFGFQEEPLCLHTVSPADNIRVYSVKDATEHQSELKYLTLYINHMNNSDLVYLKKLPSGVHYEVE